MFKVRIKTSPEGNDNKSTGQQEGYGLVRNLAAMQTSPQSVSVNDKMGAIPREEANIEVEGGESVIGDVNKDGTMELMHFVGKRHTEGGVPVNIPEGSFIFSDTKNLTIKDPEILEKIFNMPARKQGYTPAEISRKYDINAYVEILKDDTSDPLAKRSAAEMLKKNKQKLGLLAFIQESMKGFPDGIPAIAEEVLGSMGIDPNQMAQEFAPQQPQQGMGMPQEGMMPPMEGQGIPMSEDEDAMQGMIPEGPAVAPDDLANQMSAKFGGTMLPTYEKAGTVTGCPPGYYWNKSIAACVLAPYVMYQSRTSIPAWAMVNPLNIPYKAAPKKSSSNDMSTEDFANMIRGNQERFGKNVSKSAPKKVEPLGDNSFAANFAKGQSPEEIKQIELKRKYYDNLTKTQIEANKKKEAEKKKKIAEDKAKNPYKYNIPGFGSKKELEDYMNAGSGEFAAGDTFYQALLSMDPAQMISAAEDIKNIDIDWSVGWLPWTNQDKIDDMYSILHEEAYKILNQKEKEKISTYYKPKVLDTKVDDLIKEYETKAKNATSVTDKEKYAKEALKYKRYKEYLSSEDHKDWRKEVDESRVWTENTWWPVPGIGKPIQDKEVMSRDLMGPTSMLFNDTEIFGINLGGNDVVEETDTWYGGPRFKTYLEVYDEITKSHDKLKNTTVATIAPLGNKGLTHTNERQGFLNWDRPEIVENVRTINQVQNPGNSPKDAKGYANEYKLKAAPTSTFRMGKNVDGQMVWFEETGDGSEYEVSNGEWVKSLNAAATIKEGKKVALPPSKQPTDIIQMLEQENKINPTTEREQTPVKKQKTDIIAPVGNQQQTAPKPKYDNGVTESTFESAFGGMKFGGTMPSLGSNITVGDKVFRYGGLINENGKLRYDRGGSVLPKYNNAGTVQGKGEPTKSEVKVVTDPNSNGGKPMNAYTLTYQAADGKPEHATVVQVLEDQATGNIIARKNTATNESVPNGVQITRSSYDWIQPENLSDAEKKEIESRWNGKTQAYIDFKNSNNQIRLNTKFRDAIVSQFQQDVQDPELRMYTGEEKATRKKFADLYGADIKTLAQNPEAVINTMMQFEENNARMAAFGYGDRTSGTGPWSDPNFKAGQNVAVKSDSTHSDYQGNYVNTEARQIIKDNQAKDGKVNLSDIDFSKNELGQGTYISYRRALMNSPEFQGLATHQQTGEADETTFGIKGKVSGIDRYSTNTTLEERLGYNLTPPPPEIIPPGEKGTYYCVEYSDGTKEIKTVTYKEGEQPVAPSGEVNGKTVTKATQYETSDEATKNCEVPKIIPPPGKPTPQPDTWFAPDIVNYAAGVRQIIPNTPPVLRQMNAAYSGYDTLNPITRIAGITGLMRQQQDLAMNTMDPTVGFAAMAGQGYDDLGKQIADVEEGNVTKIVNPYLQTIGQLNTDVDYKNTMLRSNFDTQGATYQEELAAQRNKKAAQEAMLWGQGWGNVQKDNALRVAYPNAWHAQRLSPTFAWSGVGRDPLAADTYMSPVSGTSTQADCASAYATAYDQVKNDATMDEDAKKEYASNMQKACISQNLNKANSQNKTQQQMYSQGLNTALGNSRFGGVMYTAPGSMEFGGSYFDDY